MRVNLDSFKNVQMSSLMRDSNQDHQNSNMTNDVLTQRNIVVPQTEIFLIESNRGPQLQQIRQSQETAPKDFEFKDLSPNSQR